MVQPLRILLADDSPDILDAVKNELQPDYIIAAAVLMLRRFSAMCRI